MNIRQYLMHDQTHSLSIPRGAKFRGARNDPRWSVLFFEHRQEWTQLERWDLVLVRCDQSPMDVVEGSEEQFEFIAYLPATHPRVDLFLYRKVQ